MFVCCLICDLSSYQSIINNDVNNNNYNNEKINWKTIFPIIYISGMIMPFCFQHNVILVKIIITIPINNAKVADSSYSI